MTCENTEKHLPTTVSANLEARLAPFSHTGPAAFEKADLRADRVNEARYESRRLSLVNDLKLLFASLGAGNSVVPLGDNSRAARLLSEYAKSLRSQ